jgi:hypothetical protein
MSYTTSHTFTRANARTVATKVSADLGFMRIFYGQPSEAKAQEFEDEITELLALGYLDHVTYGFKKGDAWVLALRYHARLDGTLSDDGAGRLLAILDKDVTGASFYSFLVPSSSWNALSEAERDKVRSAYTLRRGSGSEPGTGSGYWETDRSYASGGGGVSRSILRT